MNFLNLCYYPCNNEILKVINYFSLWHHVITSSELSLFSSILQIHRVDYASETLDLLQRKECPEGDGDLGSQVGLLCGSPPARTNNPVVRDAEFGKHSQFSTSPIGVSLCTKPAGRVKNGSPSCGSSPEVRIEGFACGNSESHCAVPALA
ncbi:hypothetical protein BHE74_00034864 [Ensete ventricosum]|nr:hypothetical protein BHE74_00034864 [Ensete ventricosum]